MQNRALLLAGLAGLAVLAGVWRVDYTAQLQRQADAAAQHERNAARAAAIVANRVSAVTSLLRDTGNIVAEAHLTAGSSTAVFDRFISGGGILIRHPEIDAIAFTRFVPEEDVARVTEEINADLARSRAGHGRFQPRPASDLGHRVMVELIRPISYSQPLSGFDLMTTPRAETLDRARRQRIAAATGKIALFGNRPGIVIYTPVYLRRSDTRPFGFTGAGFVTDVFLSNLSHLIAPLSVDVEIFDLGAFDGAPLPLSEETRLATLGFLPGAGSAVKDDPRAVATEIAVADRRWSVIARPSAPPPRPAWIPGTHVALGGVIALLISSLVYISRRDANDLAKRVAEKTADLRRALAEIRSAEAEAQHQAVHDELTGLWNRRGLQLQLGHMTASENTLVLSVDLNDFNAINDSRGHAVGDAALRAVAAKLAELAPADALVARIGSDTFAVAHPEPCASATSPILAPFLAWAKSPIEVSRQTLRIDAAIGSAHSEVSGCDPASLLADADIARHRAKLAGPNLHLACTRALRAEYDDRRQLAEDLREALERRALEPFFQTQHDAQTRAIVGAEVLVRWPHPERGMIAPAEFLPLAESLGVMHEIDAQILDKSLAAMRSLEDRGLTLPKLNINVSYARLSDPRLHSWIDTLTPMKTQLVFEIVEAVFLDDLNSFDAWELDRMRAKGIGIELDDFGTGHASVVALTELRPDRLKIDKTFVLPLPDPGYEKLVRAIVSMGLSMGIPATAEGVESEDQARVLRALGVDTLQGFHFSHPMPLHDLEAALRRQGAEAGSTLAAQASLPKPAH